MNGTRIRVATIAAALAAAAVAAFPAHAAAPGNAYVQNNWVSDQPGVAALTDPNLVNAWGLAAGPTSPIWVANNHTDTTTLYGGHPTGIIPLVVSIAGGAPTGTVFNGTSSFVVSAGGFSAPALFLFASETGNITGWNPGVPPQPGNPAPPSTVTEIAVHRPNAIYKGLTLATGANGQPYLYAADFHRGRIDVFDGRFMPVHLAGGFRDPGLPPGYAPFNVQELGGKLYVAYAKQDAARVDNVDGPGKGFVDVYSPDGALLLRVASHGALNAPWGLALAPHGWGLFQDALLVGNFGDGRIHAYDAAAGHLLGVLRDPHGHPLWIDGLWGLKFGNSATGSPQTLLFAAGPAGETHGLFGGIRAAR